MLNLKTGMEAIKGSSLNLKIRISVPTGSSLNIKSETMASLC
jgi:hypothetical protein